MRQAVALPRPEAAGARCRQANVRGCPIPETTDATAPRSELEHRLPAALPPHGLPARRSTCASAAAYVDFLWRRSDAGGRTDGYRYHAAEQAFEDDRAGDLGSARWDTT
jgi:hypothetical protein